MEILPKIRLIFLLYTDFFVYIYEHTVFFFLCNSKTANSRLFFSLTLCLDFFILEKDKSFTIYKISLLSLFYGNGGIAMTRAAGQDESLLDYALREIKARIQNGTYPPGTKLSTQEISDSLGISRTPVVAAINRLVAQGVAEAIPRRGTIVARLNGRQIKDMIDVRRMIEEFSIPLAIKNIDFYPKILQEMQEVSEYFTGNELSDYTLFATLDTKFHQLFVSLTGNQQLMNLYEMNWSVGALFYMYSVSKMPLSRHVKAFNHHKEIFAALLSRNEDELRTKITEHFSMIYDSIEWYEAQVNSLEKSK